MMKRKVLLVLWVLSLAGFANAEEVTPAPEFIVQDEYDVWFVEATGQGEIHLFLDNVEVENPYAIALTYEEQYFNLSAYAQLEGCLPSEIVYFEVVVPPAEAPSPGPEYPEIRSSVTDESVIIQAFWDACVDDYNLTLVVDGILVDNPCVLPRCDEDYFVSAVAYVEYDTYSLDTHCEVLVPALEKNLFDVNGDGDVSIADVNAVIDTVMNENPDKIYDVNADGEINIADINAIIEYIISSN